MHENFFLIFIIVTLTRILLLLLIVVVLFFVLLLFCWFDGFTLFEHSSFVCFLVLSFVAFYILASYSIPGTVFGIAEITAEHTSQSTGPSAQSA